MAFTTKAKGDHARFSTDCVYCRGELTITNARIDPHDCRERNRPVTLDDLQFPEPNE